VHYHPVSNIQLIQLYLELYPAYPAYPVYLAHPAYQKKARPNEGAGF
jgi:hypothetical protein